MNLDSIPILKVNKSLQEKPVEIDIKELTQKPETCPYNYTWDPVYNKCKIDLKEDLSYIVLNTENDNIIGFF